MDADEPKTDTGRREDEGAQAVGSQGHQAPRCSHGEGTGCECHSTNAAEAIDTETEAEDDESWRGDNAPVVDEPAPPEIEDLATACVRFVHDKTRVALDYTPDTLPLLDHYLSLAREEILEKPELRELVLRTAGAYVGELLRRRLNGYWMLPTPDAHTWRVCGRHVLLSVNPIGIVAEALAQSEESDGPSGALRLARPDQEDVARRLAEAPPLPEDEYFLTSTRLEVIDVVVEHLRVRMEQNQQSDFEFDRDDYAHDLQPYGRA